MVTQRPRTDATVRRGRRAQERAAVARAKRQRLIVFAAGGVIVLIVVGLLAARLLLNSQSPIASNTPVPPDVLQAVADIPPDRLEAVGSGSVASQPVAIRTAMTRGPTGLPLITYIGAEYCPFCAGERWPLIVALSRFGAFSNLHLTVSAPDDIYPSTPTFTFYGATYTSQYVDFAPVELQTNVKSGGQYTPLQSASTEQEQLLRTYDAPPYEPTTSAGSIPFLDFANQYAVFGASFDVGVLQGRTWQTIAASLSDPNSDQAKAILGTANVMTAAICQTTGNTPAAVCDGPAIQALATRLGTLQPPA